VVHSFFFRQDLKDTKDTRILMASWFLILCLAVTSFPAAQDPYIGDDETCRTCHPAQYASFKSTAMGRSMARPDASDPVGDFAKPFDFYSRDVDRHYSVFGESGKYYHREIQRDASGREVYSDTREVAYSVGAGQTGRSYLVRAGDRLYMSPISFYARVRNWDLSPGYKEQAFRGFARPIAEQCLICHAGQVRAIPGSPNNYLEPPFGAYSIGCERCHGPARKHVELSRAGKVTDAVAAVVNPRKLQGMRRDNVCDQCHLRGDARVLRPGRTPSEYRPGDLLDDTVAIFSVPLRHNGEVFPGTSHTTLLRSSRCWKFSQGTLGCITCHNPHKEPRPQEKASYFQSRCLTCHTVENCTEAPDARAAAVPKDNCIACHMPPLTPFGIPHAAATDHRIRRRADPRRLQPEDLKELPGADLVHETNAGTPPDIRTLALAYAQVAGNYVSFRVRGYPLLEEALREYPSDRDVQETFGLIRFLIATNPASLERSGIALERAVALGSQSGLVHLRLGEILLRLHRTSEATAVLERGLELEPHLAQIAVRLSETYLSKGETAKARDAVSRGLKFDPGNPALREMWDRIGSLKP
jgi:hypothetical protein